MSTNASETSAEELQSLFVEVTGDESVTDEQQGTDRRESDGEQDYLAGRTEREGLSATIEEPDESF
ncbi:hypothetical protein [Natronomonas sp.]|jgi:hypothetical protein|uniref:hypothetical protein n=1 Tax=Natronomonas sp. TaxID=2184060 RepID=UPI002FC3B3BC